MVRPQEGRVAYADFLRVLATLAVLIIHLTGNWVESLSPGSGAWQVFNVYNGLMRWAVPMFVMLSGMFMLDPAKDLTPGRFLRHLARIVAALLVWGMVYAVVGPLLDGQKLTLGGLLSALTGVLRGNTAFHLWFLYMILGLYLVTPILRAFVRGAGQREFLYFFLFYFLLCILLPTLLQFRQSALVNAYLGKLYLSTSALRYVGYYVAGYYLQHFPPNPAARPAIFFLGIFGGIVTVAGTALHPEGLILYGYCTPNVAFLTVALFLLAQQADGVFQRWNLSGLSKVTFGIYLAHMLFLMLMSKLGLSVMSFFPALAVPVLAILVFLCSFLVAWLVSKLPLVGKYLT